VKPSRLLDRSSLSRLAAEFVVIVMGVLTALTADAWWQELQENRQYEEAVAALITDIDENLEGLAAQRATLEQSAEDQAAALGVIRSPESHAEDELEEVIVTLFPSPVFILLDGSLEAVRETGVWSRLPREARTLVSWIPQLTAPDLADQVAIETTSIRVNDLIVEYGGFQGLLPANLGREDVGVPVRSGEGDLDGLIRDPRLEHIVLSWTFLIGNGKSRLDDVVEELEALRTVLTAELD
jgi:hypothetical protein